jgi:type IV pilus assembly protein PilW
MIELFHAFRAIHSVRIDKPYGFSRHGFTLIESMVALLVGSIVIGSIYTIYTAVQREYRSQQVRLSLNQNLRCALAVLEQQIRMAGFDPHGTGRFGITDVRRYSLKDTRPDSKGQPALFFTMDLDEDGFPDSRNNYRNKEFVNFRIRDDANIGRRYLAWDSGEGRFPLAEKIHHIGFAYGIDVDEDGKRDTWKNGPFLIWAVDSNNDNMLDTHLDANNDGFIDEDDDIDGDGRITAADGGVLNPPVPLDRIRSVRLWILAVSPQPLKGHVDHRVYVVGDRLVPANGDGYVRRLVETVIECRNL